MHWSPSRLRRTGEPGRLVHLSPPRLAIFAAALLLALLGTGPDARAQDEEPVEPVILIGRVAGGEALLNPVWVEAADPKNHRYTFRVPSTTVSAQAKRLTAYLPKELCIVALGQTPAEPKKSPVPVTISGGRTTPVTLVVPPGQEIQLENHDPFPHRIYEYGEGDKSLQASDIEPTKSRRWTPPKPGTYELRDELAPSLRSWIVVEPKAHEVAYVDFKNEFRMELDPGAYTLRGYFTGKPVGKPLPANVNALPKQQRLAAPLVVGEKKKGDEK